MTLSRENLIRPPTSSPSGPRSYASLPTPAGAVAPLTGRIVRVAIRADGVWDQRSRISRRAASRYLSTDCRLMRMPPGPSQNAFVFVFKFLAQFGSCAAFCRSANTTNRWSGMRPPASSCTDGALRGCLSNAVTSHRRASSGSAAFCSRMIGVVTFCGSPPARSRDFCQMSFLASVGSPASSRVCLSRTGSGGRNENRGSRFGQGFGNRGFEFLNLGRELDKLVGPSAAESKPLKAKCLERPMRPAVQSSCPG